MSITPYANTAPSGVDWIGSIPTHWHIQALSQQFREHFSPNNGGGEGNVLSLSYGRIVDRDVTSNDGLLPESFDTYQIVEPGDIVLRPTDMQNDQRSLRTGIVRRRGIITSAYICLRAREVAFSAFGHLVLHAVDLTKVLYSLGGGLRQSLKFADLRRLPLPIPPAAEQVVIAAFIERETGKIDALVAEQERLIALLKEKRQALISHAVTKGLDPNVPMKDSGVEWLGQVPTHWAIRRAKDVCSQVTSGPRGWSDLIAEDGSLFVQSGDLTDQLTINFDDCSRVGVSESAESNRSELKSGDVVVCITGARTGNVAVARTVPESAYINQHLALMRPGQRLDSDFLGLALGSTVGQTYFDLAQYGLKQGLSLENVREAIIPCPSHSEQTAIASFCRRDTTLLDAMVAEALRAMALLRERRSSLISAAVTGKIDVRGLG